MPVSRKRRGRGPRRASKRRKLALVKLVKPRFKTLGRFMPSPGGGNLLPLKIRKTMKYAHFEEVAVGTGSTLTSRIAFTMNGLFDPLVAIGGHQPYGFDQWCALYNNYKVLKFRWRVTMANGASTPLTTDVVGAVRVSNLPNDIAGWTTERALENPRVLIKEIPAWESKGKNGRNLAVMRGKVNVLKQLRRFFDKESALTRTPCGANPLENVYLEIYSGRWGTGTNSATTIRFNVTLEYFAEFSNPKMDFAQS